MAGRGGLTTYEVIVAMGLLAAALWTTQAFHNRIVDGRRMLMQTSLIQRTLQNAKAEIATWSPADITAERISRLPITSSERVMTDAKWLVDTSELQEPLPCKQITLAIQWTARQQTHTSPSLTFWLPTNLGSSPPDVK